MRRKMSGFLYFFKHRPPIRKSLKLADQLKMLKICQRNLTKQFLEETKENCVVQLDTIVDNSEK